MRSAQQAISLAEAGSDEKIEARLVRARAVGYMERRDEQYYEDDAEQNLILAQTMCDLETVLRAEPENPIAQNELIFLEKLKEKMSCEAVDDVDAGETNTGTLYD